MYLFTHNGGNIGYCISPKCKIYVEQWRKNSLQFFLGASGHLVIILYDIMDYFVVNAHTKTRWPFCLIRHETRWKIMLVNYWLLSASYTHPHTKTHRHTQTETKKPVWHTKTPSQTSSGLWINPCQWDT